MRELGRARTRDARARIRIRGIAERRFIDLSSRR
jgi:hypothetical protein